MSVRGNELRTMRRHLDLSQIEVAHRAGCSKQLVSEMERAIYPGRVSLWMAKLFAVLRDAEQEQERGL